MAIDRQEPDSDGSSTSPEPIDENLISNSLSFGPPDDPTLQKFFDELKIQTPRGVAVLAAAYLEWRIRQAIKCRLPKWGKHAEEIFGTDKKPGELSYKYQARMAYSLGLIGIISVKEIDRVSQIRNEFAHRPSVDSFDYDAVSGLCDDLETPTQIDKFVAVRAFLHCGYAGA